MARYRVGIHKVNGMVGSIIPAESDLKPGRLEVKEFTFVEIELSNTDKRAVQNRHKKITVDGAIVDAPENEWPESHVRLQRVMDQSTRLTQQYGSEEAKKIQDEMMALGLEEGEVRPR